MSVEISPILFYAMAFVILGSGAGMAISKNLFHTALFMALCFLGVAGLFATLEEHFIAVVQILVYVGAITVLLVFGIMLTTGQGRQDSNPFNKCPWVGLALAFVLAVIFSLTIRTIGFFELPPVDIATWESLGMSLFGVYVLPTELAAVLLLVAMIGSVMLARGGDHK